MAVLKETCNHRVLYQIRKLPYIPYYQVRVRIHNEDDNGFKEHVITMLESREQGKRIVNQLIEEPETTLGTLMEIE